VGRREASDLDVRKSAAENPEERDSMREYQIDWNKLAKFNLVVNTTPRDPLEDVVKNDELVSWMKEYPDAMDAINKIKDKK
jgi:cytidylate kinase